MSLQRATCAQLAAPIVQFRGIPPELLGGIRKLDLCGATSSTFEAAAKVLPRLTGMHELEAYQLFAVHMGGLAAAAFAKLAGQVDTLFLHHVEPEVPDLLGHVAGFVKPAVLRHLELYTRDPVVTARSQAMWQTLVDFNDLETLKIYEQSHKPYSYPVIDTQPSWHDGPVLSSLRTLVLEAEDLGVLGFVAKLAPNVEDLELAFRPALRKSDDLDAVVLHRLRKLEIQGDLSCMASLALINLMPVTYLYIRIDQPSTGIIDLEPFLPDRLLLSSNLDFNFCHKSLVTVKNLDLLNDLCASQGARYKLWVHGCLDAFDPIARPVADANEAVDRSDDEVDEGGRAPARRGPAAEHLRNVGLSIREVQEWALGRAGELKDSGDVDGLVELAETLRKVEERRILEEL